MKDGFSSLHCLQHSNLDDVSISVMQLYMQTALLRSYVLILASSTLSGKRSSTSHGNIQKIRSMQKVLYIGFAVLLEKCSFRSCLFQCQVMSGRRLPDLHVRAEADVEVLSLRVGSGTSRRFRRCLKL